MVKIKIIVGSTRSSRFGIQPAEWFLDIARKNPAANFEIIDLKDVQLPFLDEPLPPAMGDYQHASTKAWASIIDEADGFIYVTPEYNYSIPASLKNAIDTVAAEWHNKPVGYIGYGASGGGIRSIEHLRSVAALLKMFDIHEQVNIHNYFTQLDENGIFIPTEKQQADAEALVRAIVFWTQQFKEARRALSLRKDA